MTITLVPWLITAGLLVGLAATAVGFESARTMTRLVMALVTVLVPIAGGWLVLGYVIHRRRPGKITTA